jgi:hypothetical protein
MRKASGRADGVLRSSDGESKEEVPLQVTVPARIKHSLDLKAVETGRTRRAIVLEGLRKVGVEVTDRDIVGRRGTKKI